MSLIDFTNVSDSLLPSPGLHTIVVDEAVVKDTKSGTGQYISLRWKVVGGPADGISFYAMYNFKNDNPKAAAIGQSELKRILKAAGANTEQLGSATDLEGLRVAAELTIVTDDYGEKVKIKKYLPASAGDDGGNIAF